MRKIIVESGSELSDRKSILLDDGWESVSHDQFESLEPSQNSIILISSHDWQDSWDYLLNKFSSCHLILLKSKSGNCSLEFKFDFVLDQANEIDMDFKNVRSLEALINSRGEQRVLSKLLNQSMEQLEKVKTIHERLVAFREQKMRGLHWMSKFSAGEASGGEFFDFIHKDYEVTFLLTSSTSYLATNFILTAFDGLKDHGVTDDQSISKLFGSIESDLKLVGEDEKVELLLLKIDLKTYNCVCYSFGGTQLVMGDKVILSEQDLPLSASFMDKARREFQLERGQKFIILSPGVEKNFSRQSLGESIAFAKSNSQRSNRDFLNELFLKLKRNKSSFLDYDASCVVIEVDKNAIIAEQ
jgi:hypothetical protein